MKTTSSKINLLLSTFTYSACKTNTIYVTYKGKTYKISIKKIDMKNCCRCLFSYYETHIYTGYKFWGFRITLNDLELYDCTQRFLIQTNDISNCDISFQEVANIIKKQIFCYHSSKREKQLIFRKIYNNTPLGLINLY